MTILLRTDAELRAQIMAWKKADLRVGLVPTMGALHDGHLSLVRLAKQHCDRVIASIYVNPTQFGPDEDLAAYPRVEADDIALLEAENCDAAYLPPSLYTDDHATLVEVGGFGDDLEGEHRPGHFDGVALVLTKLFNRVSPDLAVFGEKDFQQLALVRKLVADLDFSIDIMGAPIARDAHGLALSSRNRYFDEAQLSLARQLNVRLREAVDAIELGVSPTIAMQAAINGLFEDGFDAVDYLVYRDAATLDEVTEITTQARLLTVARIGPVRLLDNMAVTPPS